MKPSAPEPDWLVDWLFSHRGYHSGSSDCPENSLKAFERAVQGGFAIELDVHLLTDGGIAVFHDLNTVRMTGIDRSIGACTTEDVKMMRLLGSDQNIPLLEDVLDLVNGKVPLLIELKNMCGAGVLEWAVSETLHRYRGRCAVQSFNPKSLHWFKVHNPVTIRGQLSGRLDDVDVAPHRRFLVRKLLTNPYARPHFVGYDVSCLPNRRTSRLRERGLPILGWTVRSAAECERVKAHCDSIIFEGFDPLSTVCRPGGAKQRDRGNRF
jgi:glycerophosphoryl diester phosphodiesterase